MKDVEEEARWPPASKRRGELQLVEEKIRERKAKRERSCRVQEEDPAAVWGKLRAAEGTLSNAEGMAMASRGAVMCEAEQMTTVADYDADRQALVSGAFDTP